mmetsp:Transcript_7535/g.15125  ORF Transcript_7535/g.15125 Transcript_7535/m.15125 type:complete len:88 (+) Transcript_7535:1462-1725(+)
MLFIYFCPPPCLLRVEAPRVMYNNLKKEEGENHLAYLGRCKNACVSWLALSFLFPPTSPRPASCSPEVQAASRPPAQSIASSRPDHR